MWYEHWFDNNLSAKVDEAISMGIVKCEGGRLHLNVQEPVDPLWLYVGESLHGQNCPLWFSCFSNHLDIIHSFCRYRCWKTVTRPRNVREAIQYYNLMRVVPFEYNFINPIPGKVGLDVRKHTSEPYGAFQYSTSLVEGLKIKEIMIYMITKYMPNDEINGKHLQDTVFVKRACTEMEGKIPGDDPWWDTPQTEDEWQIERKLEEIFVNGQLIGVQADWVKDKTVQKWLNYANSIGDKSAIDIVGSDIFNVQSRKYDFGDLTPKGGDPKKVALLNKKTEKKKGPKSKEKR